MAKLTTVMTLQDKVSKKFNGVTNRLKNVLKIQDKITVSASEQKSMVGKLAATYRKQGLDASKAMTKAWTQIRRTTKVTRELGTLNPFKLLAKSASSFFGFMRKQIFNIRNLLVGLGAAKFLQFTIGGAADIEQIKTFLSLQLGAEEGAKALDFIEQRARDSIFSFEELSKAASSFSTILKQSGEIEEFTKFAERLSFLDPAQGFEGASLALKELLSGETRSLRQRFELPISDALNDAIKEGDFDEITKALDELIPVTEAQLDRLSETGAGAFKRLSSNISTSFKLAGDQALQFLAPILTEINEAFAEGGFDQFFTDLSLAIAVAVGMLIDFGFWIKDAFGFILSVAPVAVPIILGVAAAIGTFLLITKGVVIATKAWAAAQKILNFVMAANPLGIIIGLIVGFIVAIAALIAFNEKFRDIFVKVFGVVVDVLQFVVNTFLSVFNLLNMAVNGVKDFWLEVWFKIFDFILKGAEKIIKALNKIPGVDIDFDADSLRDKFRDATDTVQGADLKTDFEVDFSAFKEAGKTAIEGFDAKKLTDKIKGGLEEKFAVPEIQADEVQSSKFNTELFGAEDGEGFTLNEFIIDSFGNIIDGAGRESFIQPVEDNRKVEVKVLENAEISADTDLEALKAAVIAAVEEALEEDVNTNSAVVFGT